MAWCHHVWDTVNVQWNHAGAIHRCGKDYSTEVSSCRYPNKRKYHWVQAPVWRFLHVAEYEEVLHDPEWVKALEEDSKELSNCSDKCLEEDEDFLAGMHDKESWGGWSQPENVGLVPWVPILPEAQWCKKNLNHWPRYCCQQRKTRNPKHAKEKTQNQLSITWKRAAQQPASTRQEGSSISYLVWRNMSWVSQETIIEECIMSKVMTILIVDSVPLGESWSSKKLGYHPFPTYSWDYSNMKPRYAHTTIRFHYVFHITNFDKCI